MELVVPTREQQDLSRTIVVATVAVIVMSYLGWRLAELPSAASAVHSAAAHHAETAVAATTPPALYSVVPFVVLLLAIALLPLFRATGHWWEHNGFMVKAIAETHNVRMPGFFGYMLYSTAVLLPLSLALTWLFV